VCTHAHTHTHIYSFNKPYLLTFFLPIIIIIIVWLVHCGLVRCWTLPFLRACSWLDDSALDDGRFQRSGARCDTVGPIGGSSALAKGPHWTLRAIDCGPEMDRHVQYITEELKAGGVDNG